MNIIAKPLTSIRELIKNKFISSSELVSFYLQRINAINPLINAIVQHNEELALKKAKNADNHLARGETIGKLHGIPFTAKDWLETKEFISAAGMEERKDYYPPANATVIERLEKEGAILIGKTNVPLNRVDTDNPVYGRTNNPYNLSCTPGGSSGGEAAAIAAGLSGFGVGQDSGGSIRLPCHFCGVAGLKPTTGRIPATGHFPKIGGFIDPRSQIGPIARFVDDLSLVYPILCGNDGIDPYVIDMPFFNTKSLTSLKIAYYLNHKDTVPDDETIKIIEDSINFLRTNVLSITYHEPEALSSVLDITYGYWSLYKSPPNTKEYLALLKSWDKLRYSLWQYIQQYDAIITPVCTTPAHKYGDTPAETFPYTLTYSLVGWPCAVVRVGTTTDGLPVNAQIIAKPFHEEVCLIVAKQLEMLCGWKDPTYLSA